MPIPLLLMPSFRVDVNVMSGPAALSDEISHRVVGIRTWLVPL
jgi:hypothetical protein